MFIDLVQQELGESKSAVHHTRFCCPFCHETDHKFYVHNEEGLWICFKCDERGNPAKFVMDYFNATYPEAVDILLTYDHDVNAGGNQYSPSQYGSELSPEEQLLLFISREGRPFEEAGNKRLKCPPPPTNCKTLVQNFNNPEAYPFFQYLHGRGVTLDQIKEHNISYVIEGEVELADGRKLTLKNHVIFYTFDENRKPLYWNTRCITDWGIKSFNAPSREGEYSKNTTVFNLNNAKYADKVVVHEGVFNSFMTPRCGVATFGKQITDVQINLLLNETPISTPIYLFLDTDAWEQMISAANRIKNKQPLRLVYYVYSGLEEDANDLGVARCLQLLEDAMVADAAGELQLRLMNA
jgi:DNA primase